MDIIGIVLAMAVVGVVGCLIGFILCVASEKLKVEVDEREEAVLEALPGVNCGACGYSGCAALAKAIAKGEAPTNKCPVGGSEVGKVVSGIMGVEMEEAQRMVSYVRCSGTCQDAPEMYKYEGIKDCTAMAFVPGGGSKSCKFGCMGYGSCQKVCNYGAITIVDGIAKVDPEKCTGCKMCIDACPKHLIELIPYDAPFVVACRNTNKGKAVMEVCNVGCIGCGLCAKNCPVEAITVDDNVASIDYSKCTGCGTCIAKCPKSCIDMRYDV